MVRQFDKYTVQRFKITEVEAYRGSEIWPAMQAKAKQHEHRVMFGEGGFVYVYLIYGMYWMLNIVTGEER